MKCLWASSLFQYVNNISFIWKRMFYHDLSIFCRLDKKASNTFLFVTKDFSRHVKFMWKYKAIYQAKTFVALMISSNLCHMGFSTWVFAVYILRSVIDIVQIFCYGTKLYFTKFYDKMLVRPIFTVHNVQVNHI